MCRGWSSPLLLRANCAFILVFLKPPALCDFGLCQRGLPTSTSFWEGLQLRAWEPLCKQGVWCPEPKGKNQAQPQLAASASSALDPRDSTHVSCLFSIHILNHHLFIKHVDFLICSSLSSKGVIPPAVYNPSSSSYHEFVMLLVTGKESLGIQILDLQLN